MAENIYLKEQIDGQIENKISLRFLFNNFCLLFESIRLNINGLMNIVITKLNSYHLNKIIKRNGA